jgi:hypothetical protein
MKFAAIALSVGTACATWVGTAIPTPAAILINQTFDVLNAPPAGEGIFRLCADGRACDAALGFNFPFTPPQRGQTTIINYLNDIDALFDTDFLTILGSASSTYRFGRVTSNTANVNISADRSSVTFTGAVLNPGQVLRMRQQVDNEETSAESILLLDNGSAAVPEPTAILGIVAAGAIGGWLKKKHALTDH